MFSRVLWLRINDIFYRFMRPGLVDAQTFQQPPELLRTEAQHLFFVSGPLVLPTLQTLIQQNETIRIPVQGLKAVCSSAAEQEQGIGKRIQLKPCLNDAHQPVNSPTQVGVAASDIYMLYLRWVKHLILPIPVQGAEVPDRIRHSLPPSSLCLEVQELASGLKLLGFLLLALCRE